MQNANDEKNNDKLSLINILSLIDKKFRHRFFVYLVSHYHYQFPKNMILNIFQP